MIQKAEIKNFRCFQKAELNDCKSVNIVVGDNGGGKTSLLEALFLVCGGGAELSSRIRTFRGMPDTMSGELTDVAEALWLDLFHRRDKKQEIQITTHGTKYRNRYLSVKWSEQQELRREVSLNKSTEATGYSPVLFKWVGPPGFNNVSKPELREGKLVLKGAVTLPEECFFLPSGHVIPASETARRFSEISKRSDAKKVVESLRQHFPIIEDLTLEIVAGNALVCAKVQGMDSRVPLNMLSSGLVRIAHILFTLYSRKGSIFLIDEIENGVHHKKLPQLWASILDFCKQTGSQVFASTHSLECIVAAKSVVAENTQDFTAIHADGNGEVFQYGGERFANAVESGFEVR